MPQMQRLILALCVVVVLAVFGVAQASAQVQTSAKPPVVVNKNLSLANVTTVWCWGSPWYVQWHRRSTAGLSLWKYRLTVTRFCWTGSRVAAISSFRSMKVSAPLWDPCCHLGQTRRWNNRWSFRRWTEAKFVWAGPMGLAVRTPEVWFKVRGDGWYDWGAVGD